MSRWQFCISALCLLAAAAPAFGGDLLQVYELAAHQDPRYRSVQADLRAVQESKPQARAEWILPKVDVGVDAAYNWQDITSDGAGFFSRDGDFQFETYGYTLDVRQPVFHYDRYLRYQQADHRIQQAKLLLDAEHQDLMIRVAERYFAVLAAQDTLTFARAEKEALTKQLEQTQQRFAVGLLPITDVQEAQAGFDLSVASEIDADKQLADAKQALREVVGEYPDPLAGVTADMPLITPQPADTNQWTDTALRQNLRLLAALAGETVAMREIQVQRAQHYPTLDIVGSHGSSTSGSGSTFGVERDVDSSGIGVQVAIPIYQGGIVESRVREASARYDSTTEKTEEQRRAVIRQTQDAYRGVLSGISRVQALAQAVKSTETALAATKTGFEVGTRTAVDVVTQERELSRAKRDYARARYDYVLSTLRLKQSAGSLAPADLAAVNSWLMADNK